MRCTCAAKILPIFPDCTLSLSSQTPDGKVINKNHRTVYILEFERSSNRNEDFLGVKQDEANDQHKSIIEALKAVAAPEWTFEQINFVAGMRGAVVEDDFEESSMNTLWQKEEFEQICSRESRTENAAEIEKTISAKEHEKERHDFDPTTLYKIVFGMVTKDSLKLDNMEMMHRCCSSVS